MISASRAGFGPLVRDSKEFYVSHILLITMLVVGAWIVFQDGFARGPFEWVTPDPLTYEPYPAAKIFAVITLPLTLLYAASVRAPLSQAVFLWFILCTVTYAKDYAYI